MSCHSTNDEDYRRPIFVIFPFANLGDFAPELIPA